MRKLPLTLALVALTCSAFPQRRVFKPARTVRVFVGGSQVSFDRVVPIRVGRRILVPLRGVFEKMGATVRYDAKRGKTNVVLNLDRRTTYVNGEPRQLDTWPKISKGHVLVPIRFVAETLNASVAYSSPDATVRIIPH